MDDDASDDDDNGDDAFNTRCPRDLLDHVFVTMIKKIRQARG